MGYRSDVVIGIHKTILARNLITSEIPKEIIEFGHTLHDDVAYFKISDWKWYPSYPEVAAIEEWFAGLVDEQNDLPEDAEVRVIFGAMRIGESDDDVETWGDPYSFDICLNRSIDFPMEAQVELKT